MSTAPNDSAITKHLPTSDQNSTQPSVCGCSCSAPGSTVHGRGSNVWNLCYFGVLMLTALLWSWAYMHLLSVSDWLVDRLFGLAPDTQSSAMLKFFIFDCIKIFLLLTALIYAVAWLRAALDLDRLKRYLSGKGRASGYVLAASFGAVTPFCSCSSVPLFLGFASAGLPLGFSMAFLITSPLINEIAAILLWSLLGWKFATVYISIGMLAGIFGGVIMDHFDAGRWLRPLFSKTIPISSGHRGNVVIEARQRLTIRQRHRFAWAEMTKIVKRIWIWVIVGVGIGALLHGFIPENWFAENLDTRQWWAVPAAVLTGIPLYSNVSAIVPVMESLLIKGLPLGTALAFCMSSVAISLPELIMLRQIMTTRLQLSFIAYLLVVFTLVGWLFNSLG